MYIPKISVSLKILTYEEVKNLVATHFSEYFISIREPLYSKLSEKQDLRKIAILLYIFLTTPDVVEKYVETMQSNSSGNCVYHYNIEILNLFDPEIQLINTKPMNKNKLKESLSDLKKFKAQTVLVLDYMKWS